MPGSALRALAVICLSLGGVLCLAQPSRSAASAEDLGLVVESVARNSMAARAGLQKGDLLLSWTQGGKSGNLDTPFELAQVEIERGPRGTVTILGSRGDESKTWQLGDDTWHLKTRPRALESLISSISSVAPGASADAKKSNQQEVLWQRAADQARKQADRPVLISWLLFRSAEALADQERWDESDAACRQSLQSWPDSESALLPYLLKGCGDAFYLREKGQSRARKYLTQALEAARRQDTASLTVASLLSSLGRIDIALDNLPHAEEILKQTVQIQERLVPGTLALAFNLNRLGVIYQYEGKLDEAKVFIGRALELRENLAPGTQLLATSLENFGDLLDIRGEPAEAAEYLSRACPLFEKLVPESLLLAGCYVDAGTVALDRKDLSQAEKMLRGALAIQRRLRPRGGGVSSNLNNLGLVLLERHQFAEAENSFKEALAIKQEASPDSLDVAITLDNLGLVNMERGNPEAAKPYLQKSLAIREKLAPGSIDTGIIYEHFGRIAITENKLQLAEDYLGKALRVTEHASPMAIETSNVHQDLGDLALQKGELARAEKEYSAALSLREKSSPGSWLQAESLWRWPGSSAAWDRVTRQPGSFSRASTRWNNRPPGWEVVALCAPGSERDMSEHTKPTLNY
jgi:tetratricopeptide (TPR) repeat protein